MKLQILCDHWYHVMVFVINHLNQNYNASWLNKENNATYGWTANEHKSLTFHLSNWIESHWPQICVCWLTASLCLGGSDIFATVSENSPVGEFIANLSIIGDPTGVNSIRLCLTGENANWFYLEGRTIRLNSSIFRVLDREVIRHPAVAVLLF